MTWFKNLGVRAKLMVSFGLLLAVTGVIGGQGFRIATALNGQIDDLYRKDVVGLTAVKDIEVDKALIARCSRNAILDAGHKDAIAAHQKEFAKLFNKLKADLANAETTETSQDGREKLNVIKSLLAPYAQSAQDMFQFASAGQSTKAKARLKEAGKGVIQKLNDAVRLAAAAKQKNVAQAHQQAEVQFSGARVNMIVALVAALGLGVGLALLLANIFCKPIKATVEMLELVAAGDLTHKLEIQTSDELGQMAGALNRAIMRIGTTLAEVSGASRDLSSASRQVANAAQELASGAQEQAASLEETSASLEQITATVQNNSDSASQASKLAFSSCSNAEAGGQIVAKTVAAMSDISSASAKIVRIIDTVDEIAFRTNMLALNAAIEAARAGEQGRGFSAVATEVRALALQSAEAAAQIRGLIAESVKTVENGSTLVDQSGRTLTDIVSSVTLVKQMVEEIATASQEQAQGIEHVGMAMTQVDRVMQRNSAQTEELSSTAALVASQASQLERLVDQFVLSS